MAALRSQIVPFIRNKNRNP